MFLVYDQIVGYGVSFVAILSDVLFVVSPHIPLGIAKDITSVWYNNQSKLHFFRHASLYLQLLLLSVDDSRILIEIIFRVKILDIITVFITRPTDIAKSSKFYRSFSWHSLRPLQSPIIKRCLLVIKYT